MVLEVPARMETSTHRASLPSIAAAGAATSPGFLTREEEIELAQQYRDTHDPKIARRLIESHLRLVAKIAGQCCSRRDLLPDLIQEGCLGLMRAVEKFDPKRGIRLSSYAAWWIRAFIYQYIMTNSRLMRVATTFAQRKLFFNLNRECQRLERDGQEAQSKDIAANLNIPEKTVIEMRARLGAREVQFETTVAVHAGSERERLDGATAPQRPDELVEDRELRAAVAKRMEAVVGTLNERDRAIFDERIIAETPTTLSDLGNRYGISRERARQLENRLKQRLRQHFEEFAGERRAPIDTTDLAA
jgi:RNA polymerase sigma-32 factor